MCSQKGDLVKVLLYLQEMAASLSKRRRANPQSASTKLLSSKDPSYMTFQGHPLQPSENKPLNFVQF